MAATCAMAPPRGLPQNEAAALEKIGKGVQEEMMVAMLNTLQVAAAACSEVCVKRLQDLHGDMLKAFDEVLKQHTTPATLTGARLQLPSDTVRKRTSFHQLYMEPGAGNAQGVAAPGTTQRFDAADGGDSDAPTTSDGEDGAAALEDMYEGLGKPIVVTPAGDRPEQQQQLATNGLQERTAGHAPLAAQQRPRAATEVKPGSLGEPASGPNAGTAGRAPLLAVPRRSRAGTAPQQPGPATDEGPSTGQPSPATDEDESTPVRPRVPSRLSLAGFGPDASSKEVPERRVPGRLSLAGFGNEAGTSAPESAAGGRDTRKRNSAPSRLGAFGPSGSVPAKGGQPQEPLPAAPPPEDQHGDRPAQPAPPAAPDQADASEKEPEGGQDSGRDPAAAGAAPPAEDRAAASDSPAVPHQQEPEGGQDSGRDPAAAGAAPLAEDRAAASDSPAVPHQQEERPDARQGAERERKAAPEAPGRAGAAQHAGIPAEEEPRQSGDAEQTPEATCEGDRAEVRADEGSETGHGAGHVSDQIDIAQAPGEALGPPPVPLDQAGAQEERAAAPGAEHPSEAMQVAPPSPGAGGDMQETPAVLAAGAVDKHPASISHGDWLNMPSVQCWHRPVMFRPQAVENLKAALGETTSSPEADQVIKHLVSSLLALPEQKCEAAGDTRRCEAPAAAEGPSTHEAVQDPEAQRRIAAVRIQSIQRGFALRKSHGTQVVAKARQEKQIKEAQQEEEAKAAVQVELKEDTQDVAGEPRGTPEYGSAKSDEGDTHSEASEDEAAGRGIPSLATSNNDAGAVASRPLPPPTDDPGDRRETVLLPRASTGGAVAEAAPINDIDLSIFDSPATQQKTAATLQAGAGGVDDPGDGRETILLPSASTGGPPPPSLPAE